MDVDAAADALADRGWVHIEHFIDDDDRRALAEQVRRSPLRPARTGVDGREDVRADIRGDAIEWIDAATAPATLAGWHRRMQTIGAALAHALRLPPLTFDAHQTRYPPGTGYRPHVDAADDASRRLLSAVCYLNEDWQSEHGGQLRLAAAPGASCAADDAVIVPPLGGSLVLFVSRGLEHAVEATTVERLSLTGWYLRTRS